MGTVMDEIALFSFKKGSAWKVEEHLFDLVIPGCKL